MNLLQFPNQSGRVFGQFVWQAFLGGVPYPFQVRAFRRRALCGLGRAKSRTGLDVMLPCVLDPFQLVI